MRMEEEHALKLSKIGVLSGQGAKCHQNDDLEEAVEHYSEAYNLAREVNDDKTERTCAFNLGAAYIANGKPHEGLSYLHKATPPEDQRDDRSNGDLYFNMGLGHEKMDDEEKALENFKRASDEYARYERDKSEQQVQCLEKCFQIYQNRKDFSNAADICQLMAEVFNGTDELSKAEKLCEKATQLRFANEKEMAMKAAEECKNALNNCKPKGEQCSVAGKILNDLGLVFTQILEYDEATRCFEKAVELVNSSHKENHQLEAVVLQNLGAAYNFTGDYQRAVKFHEDAADKYAQIHYRNGQGQCFTNLAFALSQLRDLKRAEIAFHHALQASKDTGDSHMKWQALEGLGAVSFNQGSVNDAVDFFIEALKNVGENKTASERIKDKMLCAINARGSKQTMAPYRGQDQMMYSGNFQERRTYMSPHGPAEEHNQLSATPRSHYVNEASVVPKQAMPVTMERPAMSSVQDTTPKRRIVPMRKKDSIGPHMPKVARGFGTISFHESPRTQSLKREAILQEDSSEDESSSGSGSSSETSSDEDQADQSNQPPVSSQKIDQIFAKPPSAEMSPGGPEEEQHLSMYEAKLRAQEENEESEGDDSSEDSSSSSGNDSDDDSDDEATEAGQDERTYVNQPMSPPPLPTQSPPNTTQVSTKHLDTYLTPASHVMPDAHLTTNAHTVHTVVDVHEPSDSSYRGAKQQPKTAESPRDKSSSDSNSNDEDDDDKNDDKDPYATIDTSTKSRQPVNGQGNETGSIHQHRSGRRSENFFDNDQSEKKNEDISGEENPYSTMKFEREGPTAETGESSAMKIDQLPRGQREVIMAQYHHEHQSQEPPPLPARNDEKASKSCVIM